MKNQKRSRSSISINHLPDEVLMEILKRLLVTDLLKYCRVCQKWKDLISSKHFKDMHAKSSCNPPMVLVSLLNDGPGTSRLLLLQNIWDTTRKRLTIRKLTSSSTFPCSLFFMYRGLIVFYDRYACCGDFIFNSVSGDKLNIRRPMGSKFVVFGMFFNTLMKEYCILWGSFKKIGNVRFKMLVIGAQQIFKDLKPPNLLIKKPRFPPVIIDDVSLYWMLQPPNNGFCEEVIMAFDTKKEEFSLMPHPGSTKSCRMNNHNNMNIAKIDDCLSFVRFKYKEESFTVKVWILKDFDERLWVKSHKVSFNINNWDGLSNFKPVWNNLSHIIVMAAENGELLLKFRNKRRDNKLFACNLKNGTVRKIGSTYHEYDRFYTYVPSFAPIPKSIVQSVEVA